MTSTQRTKHLIAAAALTLAALLSSGATAAAVSQAPCRPRTETTTLFGTPPDAPDVDVRGQSLAAAAERLSNRCMVMNDTPSEVDEKDVVVTRQELRGLPHTRIAWVTGLWLGVVMPDVVGKTLRVAEETLAPLGLTVRTSPSDGAADWTVRQQRPGAGEYQEFGERVTLVLNEPVKPVLVPVPDLINHTETEAATMVKKAGLVYAQRILKAGKRPGRVVSQQPQPGELVNPRSTVRADIRRVPAPTPPTPPTPPPPTVVPTPPTPPPVVRTVVPDVVGRLESTARQMIEVARLRFDSRVLHPGNAAGIVMSQSPPAGTPVAVGTVVTVDLTREQILIPAADESNLPSWLVPLVLATAVLAAGTISRLWHRPHKDSKPPMPHIHAAGRLTPGVPRIHESGPAHRIRVSGRLDRGRQYLQEKSDEHQ